MKEKSLANVQKGFKEKYGTYDSCLALEQNLVWSIDLSQQSDWKWIRRSIKLSDPESSPNLKFVSSFENFNN